MCNIVSSKWKFNLFKKHKKTIIMHRLFLLFIFTAITFSVFYSFYFDISLEFITTIISFIAVLVAVVIYLESTIIKQKEMLNEKIAYTSIVIEKIYSNRKLCEFYIKKNWGLDRPFSKLLSLEKEIKVVFKDEVNTHFIISFFEYNKYILVIQNLCDFELYSNKKIDFEGELKKYSGIILECSSKLLQYLEWKFEKLNNELSDINGI